MKKFLLTLFCLTLLLNTKTYAANEELSSAEWDAYRADVEKIVRQNWRPSVTQTNAKTQSIVVHIEVDKRGNLEVAQIVSTVDEDMAKSVIKAVEHSAPFPAPPVFPQGYTRSSADVDFTFDLVLKEFGPLTRILEGEVHKQTYGYIDDKDSKNDYMQYLKQVQSALRAAKFNKMPPAQTLVQFDIAQSGDIQNLQVLTASKNPNFDKAAVKYVQNLSLPSPPPHLNLNAVTIQCVISNASGIRTPGRI